MLPFHYLLYLSSNYTFYKVFREVGENVRNSFDDKINDLVSYRYMFLASLGFLVCTILLGLAYCKFEDLNHKYNIIYTMAFISNITTFVFAILMKRKNSYGEQIKSKIDGFKNYIELVEKDQLEMLVEELDSTSGYYNWQNRKGYTLVNKNLLSEATCLSLYVLLLPFIVNESSINKSALSIVCLDINTTYQCGVQLAKTLSDKIPL